MVQGRSADSGVARSATRRSSGQFLAESVRTRLSDGKGVKREGPSGMRIPVKRPNCQLLVIGCVFRQLMTLSTASWVIQGISERRARGAVLTLNPVTGSVEVTKYHRVSSAAISLILSQSRIRWTSQ